MTISIRWVSFLQTAERSVPLVLNLLFFEETNKCQTRNAHHVLLYIWNQFEFTLIFSERIKKTRDVNNRTTNYETDPRPFWKFSSS